MQEKKEAIEAMTNVRPPPPEMCSKYDPAPTVTTEAPTAETPASINLRAVSNDDDPRDQLCPIVGKWYNNINLLSINQAL